MVFALSYEADFPGFHFNLQSPCPLEMGLQTAANAEGTKLENKNSRKRRQCLGAEENGQTFRRVRESDGESLCCLS